ncbi:MAG: DUF4179 domain-containing protein [Oscillospiraceae bacterium]|nr:DUF4179 domain-containing protein [Oscillospiraceae bacterium]
MKRNISELLDDLAVDDIELNNAPLLSSPKIREKTMERAGISRKKRHSGIIFRVAVIAAVLTSLMVTAFAADTVFNDGRLFGGFFGDTLSDKQVAQMEDIGKTFGESVTSHGTTITTLKAIADGNTMYLHLRVEAPIGTVLPDLDEDQYYSFTDLQGQLPIMKAWSDPSDEWVQMYVSHCVTPLADEDPTDHIKEFVIRFEENGTDTIFNGPWQKVLTLPGLYIHSTVSKEKQTLFRGLFQFDVTINDENRDQSKLVIEVEDATYYDEKFDFTTTVSKVTITPLRIDVECEYTQPNDKYIFPNGGPVELVMKDGTVIKAINAYLDARESGYHPDSIVASACYSWFDVPIVVEDIDYVRVGDDYIADVN